MTGCSSLDSAMTVDVAHLRLCQVIGGYAVAELYEVAHDTRRPRAGGKPATRPWRREHLPQLFARVKAAGHDTEAALTLIAHHFSLVWSAAELPLRAFRQLWGPTIQRSTPVEERAEKLRAQLRRQLWPRGNQIHPRAIVTPSVA